MRLIEQALLGIRKVRLTRWEVSFESSRTNKFMKICRSMRSTLCMLSSNLVQDLSEQVEADTVGVLYLGDLDSFFLASSASLAKKNVVLYAFTLDQKGSDYLVKAKRVADLMRWQIFSFDIKTEHFSIQVKDVLGSLDIAQKRELEYSFVLTQCITQLREHYLLCGVGLDLLCGLSKHYKGEHRNSPSDFRSKRLDNLALDSTLVTINSIEKKYDKIICAPYLSFPRTFQYLMRRDWQQLNFDNQSGRVVLKAPLRFACKRDLQEAGLVDTYTKAFRSSGLNNLVRELLRSRSVNFNSRRRWVEVLMDWRLKRLESL